MTYEKAQSSRFHAQMELDLSSDRFPGPALGKEHLLQERELSYRFHLHQHPYVQTLIQRLLRKGSRGLQAADTQYHTRVGFDAPVACSDAAGNSIQIQPGEVLFLEDGATALLNGKTVRFVGSKLLQLADQLALHPPPKQPISLPKSTRLTRGGGALLTTQALAQARLLDGGPRPQLFAEIFSAQNYQPSASVKQPYPVKDLDFSSSGAYSVYNWELFFHVPLTLAIHLSKNQRFAEAQHWFHYLFDPTDDSDGPTPERFWKVRPFQDTDVRTIETILINLATGADPELRNQTIRSIEAWKDAPFRPHVIARFRQQAFMYKTVMAYLDNLIAWGDSLFRQDSGETVDEALQLYVLAANILGPRPLPIPKKGTVRPQTYANLRKDLAEFGTVMRDIEPDIPFDLMPTPSGADGDDDKLAGLRSLGKALYFSVPRNDKLLAYWDTVADRLFKIRNSLNLQGIFRRLALFDPPIDPAMLARATAAGLDVGAVIQGLNQPLPLVRFAFLVQKAAEIAQELKALGNSLLSAMEKEDGEAMGLLRARHERTILQMVEQVRYGQLQETIKSKEGLLLTLDMAIQRYSFYERQLGKKSDEIEKSIPELDELDRESLAKMKFKMKEPALSLREIEVDIAQDLGASGGKIISSYEEEELSKLALARGFQATASTLEALGGVLAIIPQFKVHAQPMGLGATVDFGGQHLHSLASSLAAVSRTIADQFSYDANNAAKLGSYSRREMDWAFQSNQAAGEITQIFKQLRAAQLREAIAELELKNHQQQLKQALEVEQFLNGEGNQKGGKATNKALYAWMKREVKALYGQCYQFAFDIAKKAERALQHELGNPASTHLQFGYLAGKEGLLTGEKLYLDIKRMEMAYHEQNQREYELIKHVSLLQLDPLALVRLRSTGRCTVQLPEALFDMDCPGHYFRRIKTVALSIPCIAGPYSSINCTLTLLKSSIRKTAVAGDQYPKIDAEDERFSDHFGSSQSIVTSFAQNDSGLFETNLRDERYLPFENAGVISEWQLELPANPSKRELASFDYETIADVILHLRYTAREGGGLLRQAAHSHSKALLDEAKAIGATRLFSIRSEFPSAWSKFQNQQPPQNQRHELLLELRKEHYPLWSGKLDGVVRIDLLARSSQAQPPASIEFADKPGKNDAAAKKDNLIKDAAQGGLHIGKFATIPLPPAPTGQLRLYFEQNQLAELWLAVTWKG